MKLRTRFLLAFIAALAAAFQWEIKVKYSRVLHPSFANKSVEALFLETVPVQVKNLAADILWLKADEYMHHGPSQHVNSSSRAGSYAGNTDIVPLLKLVLLLDPCRIDAYTVLSQNLAFHLGRFMEGIRLLQSGILANRNSPRLHELYGTAAYFYGFSSKHGVTIRDSRLIALKYLDAAIQAWEKNPSCAVLLDEALNLQNYHVLRARFLFEMGKTEDALLAWKASGLPLADSEGMLARNLRLNLVASSPKADVSLKVDSSVGKEPCDACNPSGDIPEQHLQEGNNHEENNCEDHDHEEKNSEKNSLRGFCSFQSYKREIFQAVLLGMTAIILLVI
ncbi:MAG: hypothetical protein HQM08_09365 [Candidatus Riflebacteria bacterium]|nr:hypothetical protein [Candidatus Riflebacteria bacterium]